MTLSLQTPARRDQLMATKGFHQVIVTITARAASL
jgi:hypothetical protein